MEAYLPYIAASTLTSFLGGITYKFYNNDSTQNSESNDSNTLKENNDTSKDTTNDTKSDTNDTTNDVFNYNIIETEIEEIIDDEIIKLNNNIKSVDRILEEKNNNKYLGRTRNQKMDNMRRICREDCNIIINNNKKSKNRLIKYIKEYETNGHNAFVLSHKK